MPLAFDAAPPIRTVTTADDGWYRAMTSFAQHTSWLQEPMKVYTVAALVVLAVMALAAWWSARRRSDPKAMAAVAWLGIGSLVSLGAGLGLKQVFQESRPCLAIATPTVQPCPGPTDYSFPSDHMTAAVALAVGLWLIDRRLGVIGVVLAAIEGVSRVYLGQHYPHDVMGAAVLSAAIMLLGWLVVRKPLTRCVIALERTPLRPLLTQHAAPGYSAASPDTSGGNTFR